MNLEFNPNHKVGKTESTNDVKSLINIKMAVMHEHKTPLNLSRQPNQWH